MDIGEALGKFGKEHHQKGETLPTATREYRVNVRSGTPLTGLSTSETSFKKQV